MNELQEQILALLVAKFQGVRKDGLQHLAAAIGLQVATIEEAGKSSVSCPLKPSDSAPLC